MFGNLCLNQRMYGKTSGGQEFAAPIPGAVAAWRAPASGCYRAFLAAILGFSKEVSGYVRPHPGLLPQEKGNCRPPQATTAAAIGSDVLAFWHRPQFQGGQSLRRTGPLVAFIARDGRAPGASLLSDEVSGCVRPHPCRLPQYPPSLKLWRTRRENRRQSLPTTTLPTGSETQCARTFSEKFHLNPHINHTKTTTEK